MLAVKLHKRKRPALGRGTYLIPIMTWQSGKRLVQEWIGILNHHNRSGANDKINYISLVAIPADHPVYLAVDWLQKHYDTVRFRPFSDIEQEWKERIRNTGLLPELILGKPLPAKAVKWTKDIRLLFAAKGKRERRKSRNVLDLEQ